MTDLHCTALVCTQTSDRMKRKALKLLAGDATTIVEMLGDADTVDKASLSAAVDAALSFAPLLSEYFVMTGAPQHSHCTSQYNFVSFCIF